MHDKLVVFKNKEIRRTLHNNEWWFVVEDVVLALIDSKDPKQYIQRMKQRDPELGKGWVQIEVFAAAIGIRIFSILYDGFLRVTEPEAFRITLQAGIGHGKALGLGLLSVAPAVYE